MKKEFVRNPYNYDSDAVSEETGLKCTDESRTSQEFLEESDINYITEKFMRTGEAPQVLNLPTYGDFQGVANFQESMNLINQAKQEFMALPAKVRTRFGNDPAQLLEFVADDENYDEAVRLGFIPKKEKANGQDSGRSTETAPQGATRDTGAPTTPPTDKGTQKSGHGSPQKD